MNSRSNAPVAVAERFFAEGAILLFICGWWLTARDLPSFILPGPLEVARTLLDFATDWALLGHVLASFIRVGVSVLIALGLALVLAALSHAYPAIDAIVEKPVLTFLNSFPAVGWAILGVIWFQVSDTTILFIQVAIILPFCLINVLQGFRQLDAELDELGRSLTRSWWRRFRGVTLPLIAPFLIAGVRIAYGICWKIALVSELFGGASGLGYVLMQAQASANGAIVFATCLVIVLIFALVDHVVFKPLSERYSVNRGRA